MLLKYCKEYEEYASDKDEKELIIDTEGGIQGFLKTVSSKQAEQVDKKIKSLIYLCVQNCDLDLLIFHDLRVSEQVSA